MSRSTEPDAGSTLSSSDECLETLFYTALRREAWDRAYQEFQELTEKANRYGNAALRDRFYQQRMKEQMFSHAEKMDRWIDLGLEEELQPDEYYEDADLMYITGLITTVGSPESPSEFREIMETVEEISASYSSL